MVPARCSRRVPDYRFCHEDIRFTQTISIRHHSYDNVALLLIKLIGMAFEVLYTGNMFTHIREQIDARKGCLIVFIIGAKCNCQTITLSHAIFQVSHQRTPNAFPLVSYTHNQGMQLPHAATILANSTDPAKDHTVLIESYAADAACFK